MVKVKSLQYSPIGDELSGNAALLQAASALDAAVFFAVENRDTASLMQASTMWVAIAEKLGVVLSEDDDEEEDEPKKHKFGFNNSKTEKEDEDIDERD